MTGSVHATSMKLNFNPLFEILSLSLSLFLFLCYLQPFALHFLVGSR